MELSQDMKPQDLAQMTIENYIKTGTEIDPPAEVEGVLAEKAGVFVTLRIYGEHLRGCIGTISPVFENVATEIIHNAISAATRDPRFSPVREAELPHLSYGVDVLSAPEPARGPEDLDPSQYGVIIETPDGTQRALLLPRIKGLETVEAQWEAVHMKAGIQVGTPVHVERFIVRRFGKE